jgi:iron complex outermembrane receptor protein
MVVCSGRSVSRLAVVFLTALAIPTAAAAAAAQSSPVRFRIPAGTLDAALRAYAKITGRQILYRSEAVAALRFGGMDASVDADDALARILFGTHLVVERPAANVVVVRAGMPGADAGSRPSSPPSPIAEIVVTGTNIRGGVATGPVRTLRREDIERSGRATISDVIAAQTANFGGTGNPVASLTGVDGGGLNYSVAPAANLRGLGSDATLTLFDGRRVAGSGGRGDFTDLSAIPSLAVDRVEILTEGASAVYGSDAVGGVVNILLRHRYQGLEVRTRGSLGRDGRKDGLVGLAAGKIWRTGSIFAAYDFEHRDSLSAADRPYTATGDLRPFGGSDHRTYISSPGTVLGFDPTTSSYVPAYAIPTLPPGAQPTLADLKPGSNLSNIFAGVDLSPRIDRHAGYVRLDQGVGSDVDLFVDGRYARRTFAYGSPAAQTVFVVTPANPYFLPIDGQPFSVIAYSFLGDLGPARATGGVSALSTAAGATWRAGGGWTFDGYGTFARERSGEFLSNQVNASALNEALGAAPDAPSTPYSAARDGFFNPYGSGGANSAAVLDFIGTGYSRASRRSSVAEAVIKGEGPIVSLPGGEARFAVGTSYRRETLRSDGETFMSGTVPTTLARLEGSRDIKAVFAELQVPLVGPSNAFSGMQALSLSLALRHESYGDFGGTTNPKVGLSWGAAKGVTVRASWGTSFRAPALSETTERRRIVPTVLPDGSGGSVPVLIIAGGNPDLGPERARTFSAGFSLAPAQVPGLTFNVNGFSTRFRDRIAQPALLDLSRALTNPSLTPYVDRISPSTSAVDLASVNALLAEPGASEGFYPPTSYAAIVDTRFGNTSSLRVSGLDGDLGFAKTIGKDRLGVNLSATWLFHYTDTLTPLSPSVDRLSTLSNPADLKVRGTADWSRGALSAFVAGNFVDGYKDDASVPAKGIAAFVTADLNIGYAPRSGALSGYRFSISVENVFDKDPPFVDRSNGFGFDAANASPFGRMAAIEIRRSW